MSSKDQSIKIVTVFSGPNVQSEISLEEFSKNISKQLDSGTLISDQQSYRFSRYSDSIKSKSLDFEITDEEDFIELYPSDWWGVFNLEDKTYHLTWMKQKFEVHDFFDGNNSSRLYFGIFKEDGNYLRFVDAFEPISYLGLDLTSYFENWGVVSNINVLESGIGYTTGSDYQTYGGSGKGLTVNIDVAYGTALTFNNEKEIKILAETTQLFTQKQSTGSGTVMDVNIDFDSQGLVSGYAIQNSDSSHAEDDEITLGTTYYPSDDDSWLVSKYVNSESDLSNYKDFYVFVNGYAPLDGTYQSDDPVINTLFNKYFLRVTSTEVNFYFEQSNDYRTILSSAGSVQIYFISQLEEPNLQGETVQLWKKELTTTVTIEGGMDSTNPEFNFIGYRSGSPVSQNTGTLISGEMPSSFNNGILELGLYSYGSDDPRNYLSVSSPFGVKSLEAVGQFTVNVDNQLFDSNGTRIPYTGGWFLDQISYIITYFEVSESKEIEITAKVQKPVDSINFSISSPGFGYKNGDIVFVEGTPDKEGKAQLEIQVTNTGYELNYFEIFPQKNEAGLKFTMFPVNNKEVGQVTNMFIEFYAFLDSEGKIKDLKVSNSRDLFSKELYNFYQLNPKYGNFEIAKSSGNIDSTWWDCTKWFYIRFENERSNNFPRQSYANMSKTFTDEKNTGSGKNFSYSQDFDSQGYPSSYILNSSGSDYQVNDLISLSTFDAFPTGIDIIEEDRIILKVTGVDENGGVTGFDINDITLPTDVLKKDFCKYDFKENSVETLIEDIEKWWTDNTSIPYRKEHEGTEYELTFKGGVIPHPKRPMILANHAEGSSFFSESYLIAPESKQIVGVKILDKEKSLITKFGTNKMTDFSINPLCTSDKVYFISSLLS